MKTKKQRQEWWKSLTLEQQSVHINKWVGEKSDKRRKKSISIMKRRKSKDCQKCIHGVTKSCADNLPRGCEYFYKVA